MKPVIENHKPFHMKTMMLDWVTYNLVPVEEETISEEIKETVPSEREVFGGKWYKIDEEWNIGRTLTLTNNLENNKNVVPRKEQAEAILALSQLIQLRDETWRRNGNWKPDYNIERYAISNKRWEIIVDYFTNYAEILAFRTTEIRNKFLKKHRWLIEKLLFLYV